MDPRNTNDIAADLAKVRARIETAERAAGRRAGEVMLLAVAKGQPVEAALAAAQAGQHAFGENYLQDAAMRMAALPRAEWHFIGRIQSNKTRAIAERFAWVHTVDRASVAERFAAQRPAGMAPLMVCVQVNVDGDPAKAGIRPDDAHGLVSALRRLPNLTVRGLMTIPRESGDADAAYRGLRALFDALRADGHPLDTLSMGMSSDLETAVRHGATIVRIGTALFGGR